MFDNPWWPWPQGLCWKPTLSFCHQTNLLVPSAFLCNSHIRMGPVTFEHAVDLGDVMQFVLQLDTSKCGFMVSSTLLGNHSSPLSLWRRGRRRWEIGKKTEMGTMDGAKEPWQEVLMKLVAGSHPPQRRRSIFECWQSKALWIQVVTEVKTPLYMWENCHVI